jgi:outer membrane protein assembly factor BamB
MLGNCSTRDGRSRVPAPAAPHVTWTTKLQTDSSGQLGPSGIATDAAGNAYVATSGQVDESNEALRRVNGADGTVAWTIPIQPDGTIPIGPDGEMPTPIVLSSGGVDLCAFTPQDAQDVTAVFTFNPATGSATSTTFGLDFYLPADIAVGSDGSLYVMQQDQVGLDDTKTYVSRVGPDGTVRWTTPDLSTFGPPLTYVQPNAALTFFPSIVALGKDDLVVVFWNVAIDPASTSNKWETVALAFDASTGKLKWSTPMQGQTWGGPAVRPDGSIVALVWNDGPVNLVILDAATGSSRESQLPQEVWGIYAVTHSGVVLAETNVGYGTHAIADDGSFLWTHPGATVRTIASDGTIVAFGSTMIEGLDENTGTTKWELVPPSPSACVEDVALTSDGKLFALQCDGTLFLRCRGREFDVREPTSGGQVASLGSDRDTAPGRVNRAAGRKRRAAENIERARSRFGV